MIAGEKSEKSISIMLFHDHYGLLTIKHYKTEVDIKKILEEYTKSVISEKIKFNFFINITINNYLSKRSEREKKPKSEVLREIVLKEIRNNPV